MSIKQFCSTLLQSQWVRSACLFVFLLPLAEAGNCNRVPDNSRCPSNKPSVSAAGDYVLYFDQYLGTKFYIAKLEGLSDDRPPLINPVQLTLRRFTGKLGNADVSFDGKTIVFAAFVRNDWNIYRGDLDVVNKAILNITPLVNERGVREEDPRISWDATEVVYKCGNNICIVRLDSPEFRILEVNDICELYGPAFDYTGTMIAYTQRCADEEYDRIVIHDAMTHREIKLGSEGEGPDRFPHFLTDDRLLYSHIDSASGTASLWQYDLNNPDRAPSPFHKKTVSDDDSYAHKLDAEYLLFSGFNLKTDRYDLYVYRETSGDSKKLSSQQSIIGAVMFSSDGVAISSDSLKRSELPVY